MCAPLEFNKFINTSELLGQAKNMRLIKCHKFRELNTALQNIRAEQSVCTLEFNKFINTSELLGQAKNMRLIKCHKFRELNTALQNIRAEQSVCTSLDENAVTRSVWLGSKFLRGPCFPTILDTSNIERATAFPSFLHR